MQKYIHLLFWFLRTRNDKGKKCKPLFQTFAGREIVGYDENWPTRVGATIGAMRLETIHRQAKMNTPWVSYKFWIKKVKSLPRLATSFASLFLRIGTIVSTLV
jgi:hypothetical protein